MFEHARGAFAAAGIVPVRDLELRAARSAVAPQPPVLVAQPVPGRGGVGGVVPAARRRHRVAVLEPARDRRLPARAATPRHVERRTAADLENEAVWLGLRTAAGIDRAVHRARHGVDPVLGRDLEVQRAVSAGWLVVDDVNIKLTPAGVLFADEVASRLWI